MQDDWRGFRIAALGHDEATLNDRRRAWALAAGGVILLLAACTSSSGDTPKVKRPRTTAPPTVVPPPTTVPTIPYTVKRGDTLAAIAGHFAISSASIISTNQIANPDRLTEGQVLQIPPAPPPQLTVTPNVAVAGDRFTFAVIDARPNEKIVFEIHRPGGGKFTGSPHTATQEGAVFAGYISAGDGPGTYTVVATGDRGTSVQATYRLLG
jgi:LysM repeat protein